MVADEWPMNAIDYEPTPLNMRGQTSRGNDEDGKMKDQSVPDRAVRQRSCDVFEKRSAIPRSVQGRTDRNNDGEPTGVRFVAVMGDAADVAQ